MGIITNAMVKVSEVGSYEGDGIDPKKIEVPFKPHNIKFFLEEIATGLIMTIIYKLEIFGEWRALSETDLGWGDDMIKILDDGFLAKTFMNLVGLKYYYYATRFIP